MGSTHFLMRAEACATEMSLHVLAYNLKRVFKLLASPNDEAMRSQAPEAPIATPQALTTPLTPPPNSDAAPINQTRLHTASPFSEFREGPLLVTTTGSNESTSRMRTFFTADAQRRRSGDRNSGNAAVEAPL